MPFLKVESQVGKGRPKSIECPRGHLMEKTRKFHPNGDSYCSACKLIRSEVDRLKDPERYKQYYRTSNRRRHYKIEPEQYKELWNKQRGMCGICMKKLVEDRSTHIDHNHISGHVRGLLCHHCNTALGLFKEDAITLRAAISYMETNDYE